LGVQNSEREFDMAGIDRRMMISGLLLAPLAGCTDKQPPAPPATALKERVPAKRPAPGGLVELIRRDPTIRVDLRYATANNFTGRVLYPQARAFLQGVAADALIRAQARAKADGFGLTIFDAYRPWRVTKKLWDATPKAKRDYVANPKKGSRHNRGCAVDLSLHDLATGALVEMPSGFDDFSPRAHRDFMETTPAAIANRARLAGYMEAEGFDGMSNEWWHFDFRDWRNFPVLDIPFDAL
jgi:zinc D-Ala-D-Ala dipeptidase